MLGSVNELPSRQHELRIEATPLRDDWVRVKLSVLDLEPLEGAFPLPFGPEAFKAAVATVKRGSFAILANKGG
jgi:hypothetical protein